MQHKSGRFVLGDNTDNNSNIFIIVFLLVGSLFALFVMKIAHGAAKYVPDGLFSFSGSYFVFLLHGVFQPLIILVLGASACGCLALPVFVILKGFSISFSFYYIFLFKITFGNGDFFVFSVLSFVYSVLFVLYSCCAFKNSLGLFKTLFNRNDTYCCKNSIVFFKRSLVYFALFISVVSLKFIIISR